MKAGFVANQRHPARRAERAGDRGTRVRRWVALGGWLLALGLAGVAFAQKTEEPDAPLPKGDETEQAEPPRDSEESSPPSKVSPPSAASGPAVPSARAQQGAPASASTAPTPQGPEQPSAIPEAGPESASPADEEALQPEVEAPPAPSVAEPAPAASAPPAADPVTPAPPEPEEVSAPPAGIEPVAVRIGGRSVYLVRVSQGALDAEARARMIEQAIQKAVDSETPESIRVERLGEALVIYAGAVPLLHLTAEDAAAAGDTSLQLHADRVAAELREVIDTEQKRSAIASTIFGVSLAALLTLAALLLLRKTSEFTERARGWVVMHRENIPGIRLQSLEVVDAATIRSAVALGVEISKWLVRIGIVYLWLLLTLSLFESTRHYTQDLTGIVLTPLSSLMGRVAKSLPVLVVALIAMAVVAILLRFIDLFFAGVARGETKLVWLAADLAAPTSVILRVGVVLGALVFAAPVVTGDTEGAFGKMGVIALGVLGLASTPVVASSLLGVGILFGRKLRVGDFVELGGRAGRVVDIGLLEARLEDAEGGELRVPHLLSLLQSARVLGRRPRVSIELSVADLSQETFELLERAASRVGERATIEVLRADRGSVRYRIGVSSERPDARNALFFALGTALQEAGVPLCREPQVSSSVA